MKYRFILEDDDVDIGQPAGVQCVGRHIEHVITGEQTWDELLPHMMDWMKGCGYIFEPEARLEVVTHLTYDRIEDSISEPTNDD